MKIAVVGCGAMGSVYAGLLAAAGNEVLALTRSEAHVRAINERGLRIEGPAGDRTVRVRALISAPREPVDLIILAVKAADVESGARQAVAMMDPDTVVLTIQNGLGSEETVASIVGTGCLAVGVAAGFGASIRAPGHVHHNAMQAVRFGAFADLAFERIQAIAEVWREAGFDAGAVKDRAR
jgi:2-dehydropantoate 2-reductase